jgi:ribA/ribD-fused uncharacterized protein
MALKIDSFSGKYSFLSNFYVWSIEHEGLTYRTVEHAFQASKMLDQNERRRIANMFAPGDAKRAGRRVKLREDWEKVKVGVMLDLLRKKFAPPTLLSNALLNTDDAELIEGNTWGDRFWGVCEGEGKNIFGNRPAREVLKAVREMLGCKEGEGVVDAVAKLAKTIAEFKDIHVNMRAWMARAEKLAAK